jgi:hypothetical protein
LHDAAQPLSIHSHADVAAKTGNRIPFSRENTGLPAKSGVGGGIIAASPGKFGIAVIAPPLDDEGNTCGDTSFSLWARRWRWSSARTSADGFSVGCGRALSSDIGNVSVTSPSSRSGSSEPTSSGGRYPES